MIIDSFDLNNLLKCPVDQCHPGSRKSFKNPSVFIPFYVEIMRYIGGSTDNWMLIYIECLVCFTEEVLNPEHFLKI